MIGQRDVRKLCAEDEEAETPEEDKCRINRGEVKGLGKKMQKGIGRVIPTKGTLLDWVVLLG